MLTSRGRFPIQFHLNAGQPYALLYVVPGAWQHTLTAAAAAASLSSLKLQFLRRVRLDVSVLDVCAWWGGAADEIDSRLDTLATIFSASCPCVCSGPRRGSQRNEMILIILILIALCGTLLPLVCLRRGLGWSDRENVREMKWKQINSVENSANKKGCLRRTRYFPSSCLSFSSL